MSHGPFFRVYCKSKDFPAFFSTRIPVGETCGLCKYWLVDIFCHIVHSVHIPNIFRFFKQEKYAVILCIYTICKVNDLCLANIVLKE